MLLPEQLLDVATLGVEGVVMPLQKQLFDVATLLEVIDHPMVTKK